MKSRGLLATSFVILLIMGSFPVVAETETETHSSYQTTSGQGQTGSLQFSLVPVPVPSHPNYTGGSGTAYVSGSGTAVSIHIHVYGAASRAHFMLQLVANNVTQSVANMTADEEGELEAQAQATLVAGNYSLGLRILDTSTFAAPTLVMTTSPSVQQWQELGSQSSYTQSETEGQQVSTVGGGESDDGEVRNAIQSSFIPAVVNVGPSGASAQVLDNRFSISVGALQNNGIIVSVTAANVTGPRVILVNLTAPQAQTLFSGSVSITLDGAPILQGSSVSQVLGVQAGDPSMWVLYSSSSGTKLLVSIPHFSFHTIEILPLLAEIGSVVLDLFSVILSVGAVSAVVLIAYSRRTRFVG